MSEPLNESIVSFEDVSGADDVPTAANIEQWVQQVLSNQLDAAPFPELSIQVVNEQTISELNETYRHKSGPTNVLSFPFEAPPGLPEEEAEALLGDIVICAQVVANEAQQQHKSLQAHWAHMIVHGVLHLLGYDHLDDEEADQMESLEIQLLSELAFPNPYQELANQPS
ncbi:MAG: rRNA maturation RNase YbeY [Pseudomonadales bacterium]